MHPMRKNLLKEMGFSEKAIKIISENVNMLDIENPSAYAKHQSSCGDILMLSLKIKDDIIVDAGYQYIGCAGLQACASGLTEMIKGMKPEEAGKIEIRDIINYLEGIPKQKYECAESARDTLRKALGK
jgi:NifU-like protein involved in Fe-S cluster formation